MSLYNLGYHQDWDDKKERKIDERYDEQEQVAEVAKDPMQKMSAAEDRPATPEEIDEELSKYRQQFPR